MDVTETSNFQPNTMSNLAQEEADRFFSYKPSTTSHPEDANKDDSGSDVDDAPSRRGLKSNRRPDLDDPDTDDEETAHRLSTLSGAKQTYTVPTTAQYANTGPKGVIADAQNYHRAKQNEPHTSQHKTTTSTNENQPAASKPQAKRTTSSDSSSSDIDLTLDDPDSDPFMQTWRQKRLAELQEQYTSATPSTSSPNRTFGTLENVNATGYLSAIEEAPASAPVIVFIFDPLNADSLEVEDKLKMLAYRWTKTRFVKLHARIAEMVSVEVPAVLVYRGGEVVVTMSGVNAEGLEGVLMGQGVLRK